MNKEKTFYDKYPFYYDTIEKKKLVMDVFPLGNFVKKYIKKEFKVVDVGCGCGVKAKYIIEVASVKDYTGIDLSKESLEFAKKNNPTIKVINASNVNLPLDSNYADIVISDGVIHHTESPYTSFKEIVRIIKEGGKVYLSTYNREDRKAH